jgi:hypothetical protein
MLTFSAAWALVIPSGRLASPLRIPSCAPARVGVLVSAPASSPAPRPNSRFSMWARARARATPVNATMSARAIYRRPSARKAVKKLGPAWSPTEKMNRVKPNVATPAHMVKPRCPSRSPARSTPTVDPISIRPSGILPMR